MPLDKPMHLVEQRGQSLNLINKHQQRIGRSLESALYLMGQSLRMTQHSLKFDLIEQINRKVGLIISNNTA